MAGKTYYTVMPTQGGYSAKVAGPPEYEILDFKGKYTIYPNDYGQIVFDLHRAHPDCVRLTKREFEQTVMRHRQELLKLQSWKGEKAMSTIRRIGMPFREWCERVVSHPEAYVILDTETTGLPKREPVVDIVELSIIDSAGLTLYSQILKPKCPMSEGAAKTHNIAMEQLEQAPTLSDEWARICDVVGGRTVLAWNAWFDSGRIEESLGLHGLMQCSGCVWNWQCAMTAYSEYWNAPPDPTKSFRNAPFQKLQTACSQQGILLPSGKWHGSLFDTQATLMLLSKIATDGAKTYSSQG